MRKSGKKNKPPIQIITKAALVRLAILFGILFIIFIGIWMTMFWMPQQSYRGNLVPLSKEEITMRDFLRQDVQKLAVDIGARNSGQYEQLNAAKAFLADSFTKSGYKLQQQEYKIKNQSYYNLIAERRGTEKPNEIVIVGGHYDSAFISPGANDNGTGAAATLELARIFAEKSPKRTVRFVEFTNEEPPFFWTKEMGSLVYAKQVAQAKENVVAMLSLETMGYFSETAKSQKYPFPVGLFYPDRGNFIAFIGNLGSGDLVRKSLSSFRQHTKFPSEGVVLPSWIPGVGWSDQWSFWEQGFKGIMVTDTATYRYPDYHMVSDTIDKIDFDKFAKLVFGLAEVINDLAK
jgi:Peptidase family M28